MANKTSQLAEMASRVRPDIIIGTESWLKPKHLNADFFPPEFEVHRKDRFGKEGGGVFLAINSKFTSTVDNDLDTDHELLLARLKMREYILAEFDVSLQDRETTWSKIYVM